MNSVKNLLSISELAEEFGVHRSTVHRWRDQGMPHTMVGERSRFDREEVLEWMNRDKDEE